MAGVATLHELYKARQDQWSRCRDVSNGSDAVKAAKTKYLPMLDSHIKDPTKYTAYIQRALFFNATGRTVAGLAGGIFQRAPSIDVTGPALEHTKDITLTGQPLDMFALNVTKEYLITGRYGILIDMATEEATTPRPYWAGYVAEDIVNWRFEKMGGDQELSLVVLRERIDKLEENDEFDFKPVVQYRVLRLSNEGIYSTQVYREVAAAPGSTEKKYVGDPPIIPVRRGKALDFIPFSLPWTVSMPPLLDLVDVNLAHYRSSADLKHGLHFTALPTPWVSGGGNTDKALSIGSGTAWMLEKDGQAGMLEFTGKGLGAVRLDMIEMQRMMATLGARLLEEPPHSRETALSVSVRHSSDYATLRMIAQIVEQQITWALKVHTWWLSSEALVAKLPATVELNKIYTDQEITADELRALLLALQSNSISYKTFYSRLSDAGWTREGIDSVEEAEEIKKQPQMLGVNPLLAELPGAGAPGGPPKVKKPKIVK